MKAVNLLALLLIVGTISCKKDDPEVPNEEEVITTLRLTLTDDGGGEVVFSFQDLDGDGGGAPVVSAGTLTANTNYTGVVELLNETEEPAEDIGAEVVEEGDEHQLFFQITTAGVTQGYSDMDVNGLPLGIQTTFSTMAAGTGTLTVILRHQLDKNAANVSTGDITNAGGDTDIEVTFDFNVG